ncbi:glycosyltransferase 87 family protein [Rhodococcus sp. NPDC003322]
MPTPRDPGPTADPAGAPARDLTTSAESTDRTWFPRAGTPAGAALRITIAVAALVGIAYNLVGFPWLRDLGDYYRIDLDVYRLGGTALANGTALYGEMPPTALGSLLPFTYPPLAAIVFSPLSAISLHQAGIVLTVLSLAALLATVALTLRSLGVIDRRVAVWTVPAVFAGALLLEPVYSTLDYGQINIVLMALVAADCLLPRTPWPRGLLVGLVAAIKLTPAVFVLYFLLRKDIRAVVATAGGFLLGTGLGFVVCFSDAKQYWTETLLDSNRIGRPAYAANQSLTGMLARLGLEGTARSAVWLLCCLLVLAIAVVAVRRTLAAGHPVLALTATAVLGLLISPVSWSHHWVWAVPLLMALGHLALGRSRQEPGRRALWTGWTLGGIALLVLAPHWRLTPGRTSGLGWPLWDQFLASSYVWWGMATLALLAFVRLSVPAAAEAPTAQPVPVA